MLIGLELAILAFVYAYENNFRGDSPDSLDIVSWFCYNTHDVDVDTGSDEARDDADDDGGDGEGDADPLSLP